jgi:hypothetical protein
MEIVKAASASVCGASGCPALQPLSFPGRQSPILIPVQLPCRGHATSPPTSIPRPCELHSLGACNDHCLAALTGTGPEAFLTWSLNTGTFLIATRQTRPKRGSSDLIVACQCRNYTIPSGPKSKLRDWRAWKAIRTTQGTHWASDSIKEENSSNYNPCNFRYQQNYCHKKGSYE